MNSNARLFALRDVDLRAVKQVMNLLVIELHELRRDFELGLRLAAFSSLLLTPANAVEELPNGPRDDALLGRRLLQLESRAHRVRFAAARLTVGQHGRVVPGKAILIYYVHNFSWSKQTRVLAQNTQCSLLSQLIAQFLQCNAKRALPKKCLQA